MIATKSTALDHGQLVGRCLKDYPVIIGLHELSPVGRRARGGRDLPAVLLYAGESMLAFARLRTSGSK
jgi:hypothetical protein